MMFKSKGTQTATPAGADQTTAAAATGIGQSAQFTDSAAANKLPMKVRFEERVIM